MATALPVSLKSVQPYIKVANDLRKMKDEVTAYYCDLHAMQAAMNFKSEPNVKGFLIQLMTSLEKQKAQLSQDPDKKEILSSPVVGQTHVENVAKRLFDAAYQNDMNRKFTKNLVRTFYTSAILFDVAEEICEGELDEELKKHRKYARWKATYIHNCLKNGETPEPGPVGGLEDDWADEFEGQGASSSGGAQVSSSSADTVNDMGQNTFEPPKPKVRSRPAEPAIVAPSEPSYGDESVSSTPDSGLTPVQFNQAQKLCKYASSAIMYQDIPTALENLEKCMRLLKTGKEDP